MHRNVGGQNERQKTDMSTMKEIRFMFKCKGKKIDSHDGIAQECMPLPNHCGHSAVTDEGIVARYIVVPVCVFGFLGRR